MYEPWNENTNETMCYRIIVKMYLIILQKKIKNGLDRCVKKRYEEFCYTMKTYWTGFCPSVLLVFAVVEIRGHLSDSVYSLREDGLLCLSVSGDNEDSITVDGHLVQRPAEQLVWTRILLDVGRLLSGIFVEIVWVSLYHSPRWVSTSWEPGSIILISLDIDKTSPD